MASCITKVSKPRKTKHLCVTLGSVFEFKLNFQAIQKTGNILKAYHSCVTQAFYYMPWLQIFTFDFYRVFEHKGQFFVKIGQYFPSFINNFSCDFFRSIFTMLMGLSMLCDIIYCCWRSGLTLIKKYGGLSLGHYLAL